MMKPQQYVRLAMQRSVDDWAARVEDDVAVLKDTLHATTEAADSWRELAQTETRTAQRAVADAKNAPARAQAASAIPPPPSMDRSGVVGPKSPYTLSPIHPKPAGAPASSAIADAKDRW